MNNFDLNYFINTVKDLLNTPSPSGYTRAAMQLVSKYLNELKIKHDFSNKGAIIACVEGNDNLQAKCISSHLDTLGGMVAKIKSCGRLELRAIGGYAFGAFEGEDCLVHTMENGDFEGTYLPNKASVHIYGDDARFTKREASSMEVRLDEDVRSVEDVLALGINIGDFVSFNPHFKYTSKGYIKSRFLDDKINCAALLTYLKWLNDNNLRPRTKLYLYFTNYEEIGHGISVLPKDITELISLDIGLCTGDSFDESKDVFGDEKKICIAAADSTTVYDYELRARLVATAKSLDLPFTQSVFPRYGSDASAVVLRGGDVRIACLGPAIDATHHKERTHIDGMHAILRLIGAYL